MGPGARTLGALCRAICTGMWIRSDVSLGTVYAVTEIIMRLCTCNGGSRNVLFFSEMLGGRCSRYGIAFGSLCPL